MSEDIVQRHPWISELFHQLTTEQSWAGLTPQEKGMRLRDAARQEHVRRGKLIQEWPQIEQSDWMALVAYLHSSLRV